MFYPFFALAAQSLGRQQVFRQTVIAHLAVLGAGGWVAYHHGPGPLLGHLLLVAGIVEGAALLGWRLTQLPKSQALEFILVSPLRPWNFFLAETTVGLARLGLVTLAGLPVLLALALLGRQEPSTLRHLPPTLLLIDTVPLLLVPFTWGAVTGLGLAVWAYEPVTVRRWGERLVLVGLVLYLGVGVLAGEHLLAWLAGLPEVGQFLVAGFRGFHDYNPFGVLRFWLETYGVSEGETDLAWQQFAWLEVGSVLAGALFLARAAGRLQSHFHELHYRPAVDRSRAEAAGIGDRPLSWWAVRRVTAYSGRVNLWLAGGFGILYASYTVVGPDAWPMGRLVFQVFEQQAGGIPGLAAALVVLAAVPAAFQYGLWDSNAQDRCRRLELLLLTNLRGRDYWEAAAAAAWHRGRGYFAVAVLLWIAAALASKGNARQLLEVTAALTSGVVLWGLYFALGFRAFSRGVQANRSGALLTLGLPLAAYALFRAGWPALATLTPPGSVYGPASGAPAWQWLAGPLVGGVAALAVSRQALAHCDADLRLWYEKHQGQKVLD